MHGPSVKASLEKGNKPRQAAPVVEFVAGAVRAIIVRVVVLTDVAMQPPLVHHHSRRLLGERLAPL